MAYGDELVRVSLTWQQVGSGGWDSELAVTTFHLHHHHETGNTFDWPTEIAALPGQIHDKYATHWGAVSSTHPTTFEITGIKCAHIDSLGKTVDEGVLSITDHSLRGTGTSGALPPEVALCVSFWGYQPGTFATNKGRKRARFYLPYLSAALADTLGEVATTSITSIVNGYQALFNDIQGMHITALQQAPNPDYWAVVCASKVDASVTQVGWISVDNHFDSQRRRQHQQPPTRTVATISHS